ncbi:MAG TPA: hypothetical protein VG818_06300 [Gemmatimonadaceae bacterium]|jgi:hypothetical protein|nr:hypothetical protein [Gemmatimonadaceae bacterium]
MREREQKAMAAGFLGGLLAGLVVWSVQIQRSRRDLFSRRPMRRLAALGYLQGRPGVATARLLAEYVEWERHPLLRRRGARALRRMQAYLG